MHSLAGSVDHHLDPSNIGLPGSVGFPIGMGDILTEYNTLSANITFCHWFTPPFLLHLGLKHRNLPIPPSILRYYSTSAWKKQDNSKNFFLFFRDIADLFARFLLFGFCRRLFRQIIARLLVASIPRRLFIRHGLLLG